jgi:hypothetical protein
MRILFMVSVLSLGCGAEVAESLAATESSIGNVSVGQRAPPMPADPSAVSDSPVPSVDSGRPPALGVTPDAGRQVASTPDAGRPNMASRVWNSQANVTRWLSDELTLQRQALASWSNLATRLAASSTRVTYGTLTEGSNGVFTWTRTPMNELVVQRGRTAHRYRITQLVGDISSSGFPHRAGEILVVDVTYGPNDTVHAELGWETQKFVGGMFVGPGDDFVDVSLTNQTTHSSFVDRMTAQVESSRFENGWGSVSGDRTLEYTWTYQSFMCIGSQCYRDDLSTDHVTVDTVVDGTSYRLDYTRTETNRYRTGAQWRIGWQGTGSQGARFSRERVGSNTYSLFYSLGADRHLVTSVTSFD